MHTFHNALGMWHDVWSIKQLYVAHRIATFLDVSKDLVWFFILLISNVSTELLVALKQLKA